MLHFLHQVYVKARQSVMARLEKDSPESVWLAMDGWSAVTTGYIGAEICELYSYNSQFTLFTWH